MRSQCQELIPAEMIKRKELIESGLVFTSEATIKKDIFHNHLLCY